MVRLKPFDALGNFTPSTDGLRRRALRGAAATLLSSGLGTAMHIVSVVVLARLLKPADVGLVAMVTTFSFMFASWGLNGFTEAIIKSDDLNHALVSNVFWINLAISVLLTGAFASAGPLLAWLYGDPRIPYLTAALSLTIFLNSTWVVHLALLSRAMRFGAVSVNDRVRHAVEIIVTVLLAWAGWGYWCLVGGYLASAIATSLGAWILCQWIPSRPRAVPGTGSMVRFAIQVYARYTSYYWAHNSDNLLVGWRFGAQALGFYKKAYDLFVLAASQVVYPLTHVAMAALSRVSKDPDEYKRCFTRTLGVLAFISMGVGANLTLIGRDVIFILLGPAWAPSGRIFAFFGLGIGIMAVYETHGWIHLSIGRPDRWFRWGLIEFPVTGALFVAALPLGPIGVAMAWTTSYWVLSIPALWYAGRPIGLSVGSLIKVLWKYAAASFMALCAVMIILRDSYFGASQTALDAFNRAMIVSVLYVSSYLVAVRLLHGSFAPVSQFGRLLKEMLPRRSAADPKIVSPSIQESIEPKPEEGLS